jgi:hypothetical protein
VQAYERLHAHHFLGMFRMCPDLLFVAPADLSWVDHALANDNNDMIEEPQKELAVRSPHAHTHPHRPRCGLRSPAVTERVSGCVG